MASISLYQSEKIRESLTREQQKQIQDIYRKVAEKAEREAESLAGRDNTSSILRRQWLNDMQKKLNTEIENIGGSIQNIITENMKTAAQAVVDDNITFFEKHNISMKGAFQNVPVDVVERVATGQLYSSDWTLSKSIWKDIKDKQKDINTVIAEGIAGNKSAYEIAVELEKYVDTNAKKDWDWSKVYPVVNEKWNWTKKTVDYNAQRLARTMVSHAYQYSLVQTVKHNPFVEYIRWRSAHAHNRTCQMCAARDGQLVMKDALELDHPNGLCTLIPEIGSMDDVAERLADWANGKEDAELDKFYENAYQGDIEKISSKALKKSDKSGIIKKTNPYAGMTEEQIRNDINNRAITRLENYAKNQWGAVDVDLKGLDAHAIAGTFRRMNLVFREYPQLENSIFKIGKSDSGAMATNFSGELTFNPRLYDNIAKVEKWYSDYVEKGVFPKNTTWVNAGVHELGHRLEAEIIKSQYDDIYAMIDDWNEGSTAKKIIRNVLATIKIDDMTNKELLSTISGYAATASSEAIAEAFNDYWTNRENASVISKKIMDNIRELLK